MSVQGRANQARNELFTFPASAPDSFPILLTTRLCCTALLAGEFVLADWKKAGLNVESAVKRGIYTVQQSLVVKSIGKLSGADAGKVKSSLRAWLALP